MGMMVCMMFFVDVFCMFLLMDGELFYEWFVEYYCCIIVVGMLLFGDWMLLVCVCMV